MFTQIGTKFLNLDKPTTIIQTYNTTSTSKGHIDNLYRRVVSIGSKE